jgi:hypothetical protein
MNNEKIAESGFLPEFVVLGMLKSQGFKKVADDLITWGASLSKCESYEDFCKLNTLSLQILQDAEIDPPGLVGLDEDKQIVSLLAYSRTSSLFEKLEGLVKKRAERAEARAFKPLTLEEQNIKKQLEERLKKGIEDAKSPEQKKMEKQMLLALQAPPVEMKMMAIEEPKGKAGRPIKSTPGKEFMGMYDLTRAGDSLVKLRQEAKEKGLSSSGTKETLIDRLKE